MGAAFTRRDDSARAVVLSASLLAHAVAMLFRPTFSLPWDDLDSQGCAEDGTPEWNTLIVVGPMKRRDGHGNTTLEWTVTVQCRPRP